MVEQQLRPFKPGLGVQVIDDHRIPPAKYIARVRVWAPGAGGSRGAPPRPKNPHLSPAAARRHYSETPEERLRDGGDSLIQQRVQVALAQCQLAPPKRPPLPNGRPPEVFLHRPVLGEVPATTPPEHPPLPVTPGDGPARNLKPPFRRC